MSLLISREFYLAISQGKVAGHSIVQKFGRNAAVPNGGIEPVAIGGNWRTPTALTALRMRSSNAGDNATSTTGARKVIVQGITTSYLEDTEEVTLNGLTNVVLSKSWYRIYRAWISESGVYANQIISSHLGEIILEDNGGANDEWARIDLATGTFGVGQSQIGAYTVPAGKTAHLLSKHMTVQSSKSANLYFFQRDNIDDVTVPFTGCLRLVEQQDGLSTPFHVDPVAPLAKFLEKTDVGFMAYGDGAVCSVSVDFELLITDN